MSDQAPEGRRGRQGGGRAARQAARLHAVAEKIPFITRTLQPFEVLNEEGLSLVEHNADTILEQVGIEVHGAPDALELLKGAGCRCGRRTCAVPARPVPATGPGHRSAGVHAARAEPGEQRADRRQRHGVRARVRLAVRARRRRRPSVRHDRGLPQLREARVLLAVPAPLGRHGVRAGRPAGEQAALRHGVRAHALLRQAVHGVGDPSAARRRTRWTWRASCSAPTTSRTTASC